MTDRPSRFASFWNKGGNWLFFALAFLAVEAYAFCTGERTLTATWRAALTSPWGQIGLRVLFLGLMAVLYFHLFHRWLG